MKKLLCMLMALMLALVMGTAALAEDETETPEPEGGKKFSSSWALMGGRVDIDYEEEGYRVLINFFNQDDATGTMWEYSCYYHEDEDALVSVSSACHHYHHDPETFEPIHEEDRYSGLDEEGQESSFTVNEAGRLIWKDGRENVGADLEFQNIGSFDGSQYSNDDRTVWAEFEWEGLNEETFWYYAFLHLGREKDDLEYTMTGTYDPETGKLNCTGTSIVWVPNDLGGYDPTEEEQPCSATFSLTEDGKLLYEEGNVEMSYQMIPFVDSQG